MIALWLKLKGWMIGLAAFIAMIASAWLLGRSKGKAAQKVADDAHEAQANAQAAAQVQYAQESRNETDAEVEALPDKGPQQVAVAAPSTAAGHLRDDGWVR